MKSKSTHRLVRSASRAGYLLAVAITALVAGSAQGAPITWDMMHTIPGDWTAVSGGVALTAWGSNFGVGAAISSTNSSYSYDGGQQENLIFRSPTFELDGTGDLTFKLSGGGGNSSGQPANATDIAINGAPTGNGWMGIALRDVATNEYVLIKQNGGGNGSWDTGWTATELVSFANNGKIYTIDEIDTFNGGWGWIGLGNVTVPGFLSTGLPPMVWNAGASGNWSDATWTNSPPNFPDAMRQAQIDTGYTVLVDGARAAQKLVVSNQGKLSLSSGNSLTVSGPLTVEAVTSGAGVTMANNSTLSVQSGTLNSLNVSGGVTINVTNAGTSLAVATYNPTAASTLTKGGTGTLELTTGSADPLGANTTQLILNGGKLSMKGMATIGSIPGINASLFKGTNSGSIDLDGADYTRPVDRCFGGTQGILGMTPDNSTLNYTGQVSGFDMFVGGGGFDGFSTGFSGTFTPDVSGTYGFRWDNDDRGAMYIDLDNDGTFQSSERVGNIEWHGSGSKTLAGGTAYNFIYMTGEDGGGESNNFWMTAPAGSQAGGSEVYVNPDAAGQAGMWNVVGEALSAINMSDTTVAVGANSELNAVSNASVSSGALTLNSGLLTLSGSPLMSFASTTIGASATQVGLSVGTGIAVSTGVINGSATTAPFTFVKTGVGNLALNAGNTGLANATFDVQAGNLTAPHPTSLGGATGAQLSGGTLVLSSTGGDVVYNLATTVTQNGTLTVGKVTGAADGPLTVTLGSAAKTLTVQNDKVLTLNATHDYALALHNSLSFGDNSRLDVTSAGVNINLLGATTLTMAAGSTLNLNAGTLTTDKALSVYNLNLNGGLFVQTGTGSAKNLHVGGTLTVNNAATNLDLSGDANLTTDASATINLVNGTLTTDKALSVGNLTVESDATLNRTGTGAAGDVIVGDRLRLANKTFDTTGSTLSVGNRIELQNSTLTSGNALTVNTLWMNDNSTIHPGTALTVNNTIELYNGSHADFTGKTLSLGGIRMENNTTLTIGNAMTINGQIEVYNNSVVDFGANVLTTNWQNLYVRGGTAELKAAGNLNINYLEIWDGGGKLSVPSVTLNDRAQFRSTDSRYGNNVHSFSLAENPANPGRYVDIYGGGVDRNPADGSADLYFNGANTYTGRTQIMDGTVLVANDGVGMPAASTVRFENGIWGTSGTITRTIGEDNTGGGKVYWGNWGGFAAYGAPLTVTLATDEGAGAQLYWNNNTRGFNNQGLYLGSSNATHNVTLTNHIEINSYAQISTHSRSTLATLSGDLSGTETLDKQGPGTLVLTGDNSGFSGRNYIRRGVLDVGLNGAKLGTGRVDLQADTDDPYWKGAILQANGTLAKTIGDASGNIRWEDNGGGFAARGGSLNVTLNSGATINWNDDPSGFRGRNLMFGSGTADSVVTLANNIDAQNGYRRIYVFDNPNSATDKAVLAGNLTNLNGFEKRGDGTLETIGNAGTLSTSGDQIRLYETGTLKVTGDLRAGDAYDNPGDPRGDGGANNNIEVRTGAKLMVTGNSRANLFYIEDNGDISDSSSVSLTGNLTIRDRVEQNKGSSVIGGNLSEGEQMNLRNNSTMTVGGNLRVGAPSGGAHPGADRNIYVESGATLTANGNVQANYLQLNGSRNGIASSAHLNGATVSIGDNGSGNGNIHFNGENQPTGGVMDGDAAVYANYVEFHNQARLGGTLVVNVLNRVEMHGSNSVIAPGNSAGTLTVNGTLQLNGGSHYEFDGGDLVTVNTYADSGTGSQLIAYDGWNLDLKAGGTQISAGGSMVLFHYQTLGDFDLTPNINVADLITAGWLPESFNTATLSLTAESGVVTLHGLQAAGGVSSPYDIWAGGSFENPFTDTDPTHDPDGDTHNNLMEYGFGTDPTVSSSASLEYVEGGTVTAHGQPVLVKDSGLWYAVFGRRTDHASAGLTYTVEFSADMNAGYWVPATDAPSAPLATDGTIEVVRVPYPMGLIETAPDEFRKARFFRVAISLEP